MKKILAVLTLTAVLALSSCSNSNPLDRKYSEKTFAEDAKAIKKNGHLNEDDAKMLVGYIVLAKIASKNIEGRTYNELLADARKIREELNKSETDTTTTEDTVDTSANVAEPIEAPADDSKK